MVDALASGASVLMDVEVQVLFWAPQCNAIISTLIIFTVTHAKLALI